MRTLYLAAALALLLGIILGMRHIFRQSGRANILLAALLLGSTGVALVLVLGKALDIARTADIALVFALLAGVLGVAFVARGWPETGSSDKPKT